MYTICNAQAKSYRIVQAFLTNPRKYKEHQVLGNLYHDIGNNDIGLQENFNGKIQLG